MPKKKTFILHKIVNSRLAKKQLLLIILFSSIITLIGACLQLFVEYKDDIKYLESQFSLIESSHLESLTSSLWTINNKQIEIQLNNILGLRDIVYLEIVEKGKTIILAGKQPFGNDKLKTYPMIYNQQGAEVKIGSLHAWASLDGVYQRMLKRLFIILATQSFKTFIVSFFILFILYQKIIRHLIGLSNHTQKLTLDNLGSPFSLNRNKSNPPDELDSLVNMFNDMRQRLNAGINTIKDTDKALWESENKHRTLFESMVQGVVYLDRTGTIISANPAAERILGLTLNQILGRKSVSPRWKTIHEDGSDFPGDTHPAMVSLKSGKPVNNVIMGVLNPQKKEHTWININSMPRFKTGENVPFQVYTTFEDITERKKAEKEKENLEYRLNQAQKMEAIGTLAGGIAHDFNNILSAILGYTEMAREDSPSDSAVAKDLDKVFEAGNRAKDLVQQILAFSRQDEMERVPLQPASVVKKAIKMLRPSLPTTIEINQNIASSTGQILADPTQIHQILMNLSTNAFHAMEETGGKLGISLKEVTLSSEDLVHELNVEAGTFVQLSVCDSGPGITPEIKKNIFNPYFTTKETGKGTGMGLAIVHGIVKSCGGFISLYSEPEEGTAFHVFLPVIEKEQLPEIEDVEPIPAGRDRILFIDDEKI
ncbi:MAG: PAS domain S-box protein, partial [Bacteroidetes bacterium]|nr:PAS domain S-box protein [Bacteroidota bacterium]